MLYICYSINDSFVREAGISLTGFFENNPDYGPEEVFFLDYGIYPDNRKRLDGIAARYGRRITYLAAKPVTDAVKREFPQLKGFRGSMAPNAKAFVDRIVPDYVDRLLFMDADTVVAGPVKELEQMDMEGAALGVVPCNIPPRDLRKVKLLSGNHLYFNSGILLYNMPVWRSENCHRMIVDALHLKIDLTWPDQNLLNNAIPERLIRRLPLKYNYHTHYYQPHQERGWLRAWKNYSKEEIDQATRHPVIIHYLGGWGASRPWYEGCRSSRKAEYFRYRELTPWKNDPLLRAFKETQPPITFSDKLTCWLLRQLNNRYSFHVAYCCRLIASSLERVYKRIKKKDHGRTLQ